MEFHIHIIGGMPDIESIQRAIHCVDPAALLDVDPSGATLRIATSVDAGQLLLLMHQEGCRIERDQVSRIPSICCGGCSG